MKKHLVYLLIWLSLLSYGTAVRAQSPEALLDIAMESNHGLRALKQAHRAALEKGPQVGQLPNPEVGVAAYLLPVETRLGPQQARLSLTQMFPWFGTLQAREEGAMAEADAQWERIAAQKWELRYRISMAYLNLYELVATQEILRDNLSLLASLKALAGTKVAAGQGTLADVLRADLRIDELSQRIRVLETRKRKPLAELNQMLARDLGSPIDLPDTLGLAKMAIQKDSLLKALSQAHPQLRLLAHQQAAAHAAIRVNTLQGKPSLGIGVDYFNTGARTDAMPEMNGRDAFLIRATLSIPLYREKYRAREREERWKIDALEARRQETLSDFESRIEMAYADLEVAQLDHQLYGRQIQTTRAAMEILETDYASRSTGLDELLQLEQVLLDYRLRRVQAAVRSQIARAEILRYLPIEP